MYYSVVLKSVNMRTSAKLLLKRFMSSERSSLSELGRKCLVFNEKDGYVMKSPYEPISIPELTVDQYVWKNMPKWQDFIGTNFLTKALNTLPHSNQLSSSLSSLFFFQQRCNVAPQDANTRTLSLEIIVLRWQFD